MPILEEEICQNLITTILPAPNLQCLSYDMPPIDQEQITPPLLQTSPSKIVSSSSSKKSKQKTTISPALPSPCILRHSPPSDQFTIVNDTIVWQQKCANKTFGNITNMSFHIDPNLCSSPIQQTRSKIKNPASTLPPPPVPLPDTNVCSSPVQKTKTKTKTKTKKKNPAIHAPPPVPLFTQQVRQQQPIINTQRFFEKPITKSKKQKPHSVDISKKPIVSEKSKEILFICDQENDKYEFNDRNQKHIVKTIADDDIAIRFFAVQKNKHATKDHHHHRKTKKLKTDVPSSQKKYITNRSSNTTVEYKKKIKQRKKQN